MSVWGQRRPSLGPGDGEGAEPGRMTLRMPRPAPNISLVSIWARSPPAAQRQMRGLGPCAQEVPVPAYSQGPWGAGRGRVDRLRGWKNGVCLGRKEGTSEKTLL